MDPPTQRRSFGSATIARSELEAEIRRLFDSGDRASAAACAVKGYGPEIFGFLVAFHHDAIDAEEVWSRVTERLWKGLERFSWESSFRTWIYAIARNTSIRYRKEQKRRAERNVSLSAHASEVPAQVRSATASFLRTENRSRFAALREQLSEDDRMLLVLRVDKKLAWNDLATVMHDGEAPLDEQTLARESARLRKRFQLVKERLLEMKKTLEAE